MSHVKYSQVEELQMKSDKTDKEDRYCFYLYIWRSEKLAPII